MRMLETTAYKLKNSPREDIELKAWKLWETPTANGMCRVFQFRDRSYLQLGPGSLVHVSWEG